MSGETPVRPRALVHRGRHVAAGLLLDGRLGEPILRERVLALWTPGTRVLEVEGGLWLRFAKPRAMDAERAPGHLVVEAQGVHLATPLTSAERAALDPPPGTVVIARAGQARALAPGLEVDPSRWLALAPAVVPVTPLGGPVARPAVVAPAAKDARELLHVGRSDPGAAAFAAAVAGRGAARGGGGMGWLALLAPLLRWFGRRGARPGSAAEGARTAGGAQGAPRAGGGGLLGLLASLLLRLRRRAPASVAGTGRGAAGPAPQLEPAAPPRVGLLRRILDRLALLSGVAQLAGRRQAEYLARLLRMFERGDLAEALRHAIPLGGEGDAPLALGVPSPRNALAIAPRRTGPASAMGFGPQLHDYLRTLYRSTFERLDAQGRHQEAAFVLAELLHADEEAVSYLERSGELRLAAELAEGRGLAPGLVIRQWFLAGDAARAAAIARLTGKYGDAVDRLVRSGRNAEAAELRLVWAEDLADAGDLERAVSIVDGVPATAVLSVPEASALCGQWMARAIRAGGVAGHALVFRWLAEDAGRFEEASQLVRAACTRPDPEGPLLRAAMARGLLGAGDAPALAALAGPVARAVLADQHRRAPATAAVDVGRLAGRAGAALAQDLPPSGRGSPALAAAVRLAVAADDRGARPALDAAVLPDGRTLVALGEAGAVLVARDGRTVARLDVPAHRLVVSDLGTRALAVAPRGEAVRVSSLDLEARRAKHLRDVRLGAFASSFDGVLWVAAVGGDVHVLDALGELRSLWHVADVGPHPRHLWRTPAGFAFVTGTGPDELEGWRYDNGPALRARARLAGGLAEPQDWLALSPSGRWLALRRGVDRALWLVEPVENPSRPPLRLEAEEALAMAAGSAALAIVLRTAGGVQALAFDREERLLASVELPAARTASVRVDGERLTVADSAGRVVGVDLAAGLVTRDLRT